MFLYLSCFCLRASSLFSLSYSIELQKLTFWGLKWFGSQYFHSFFLFSFLSWWDYFFQASEIILVTAVFVNLRTVFRPWSLAVDKYLNPLGVLLFRYDEIFTVTSPIFYMVWVAIFSSKLKKPFSYWQHWKPHTLSHRLQLSLSTAFFYFYDADRYWQSHLPRWVGNFISWVVCLSHIPTASWDLPSKILLLQ